MGAGTNPSRAGAMQRLHAGDFHGALDELRALADMGGDPEDRLMLGRLAYVAIEFAEAKAQLETAYQAFLDGNQPRRAAIAATALGVLHTDGLEEPAVGQGWRNRALRLLEREGPCVEKGYALLGLMGASVASADELASCAQEALGLAQEFQDRALECKSLGDWGLALVSMGQTRQGMSYLDEACTMILNGECNDPAVSSVVLCGMLTACDRAGDLTRAQSWLPHIEAAAATSLQAASTPTLGHCWTAFGSVLCQVGRIREGETALRMGLAKGDASFRHLRFATRAALADLWIRQGRLDEAAHLLNENIERVEIMGPRARLYLARREYDLAAALARQALRQLAGDRLRSAPLLLTVIDAELRCDNLQAADESTAELVALASGAEGGLVSAYAALGLARLSEARGDAAAAIKHVEGGLRTLSEHGASLLTAAMQLELARLCRRDHPAAAAVAAETALALYRAFGGPEADAAARLLRQLGRSVPAATRVPSALDALSPREREVLGCVAEGLSNPEIAARLFITPKTAEHHVSSILSKLGLKNRAEAAAFAASYSIAPS